MSKSVTLEWPESYQPKIKPNKTFLTYRKLSFRNKKDVLISKKGNQSSKSSSLK
jgi:hypothetical protein